MSILVLAEHAEGALKPTTHNAIAAAQAFQAHVAGEIHVLVAAGSAEAAGIADQAAKAMGVDKVLTAANDGYGYGGAHAVGSLLAKLADSYSHILAPATSYGKCILPYAAALLDTQPLSDITAVSGAKEIIRPIYAGNAFASVTSKDDKLVATVRTTAFEGVAAEGGAAARESVAEAIAERTQFVRNELTKQERPELTSARVVVSGGRGMQNGENFVMLERIADKLGGAVGASRAAVDAGYVSNDYQVGQTGKVVAPELYMAVGISGAIQHLAGMKDSKVIVAINKDADAPIFQVADYGLVADLFTAVPELEQAL